jgi:hypoxanthine phosphoribosyltransferase
MNPIAIHDKHFVPYLSADRIQQRIAEMAADISRDLQHRQPLLLSVLNGSFIFAADLMKSITIPAEISFVKLASYHGTGSTGTVKQLIGLDEQLQGRCVLIVEDIIDTGITMEYLLKELASHKPGEVRIASLLFKPDAFIRDFPIDYCGFSIPNDFIVGYGLDYNGLGRNYPDIYTIEK